MGWLSASLVIAWAAVAAASVATASGATVTIGDLHCLHPLCVDDGYNVDTNTHTFKIEGHHIIMSYTDGQPFYIYCDDWQAFDSPALPRFSAVLSVSSVELSRCPPPARSHSLVDVFASMNVILQQTDGRSALEIKDLPSQPQLTARHFVGFENLTDLFIGSSSEPLPNPEFGFLAKLKSLKTLTLAGVALPSGDLGLPMTLGTLTVISTPVKPLADMLLATTSLRNLTLQYNEIIPSNQVAKVTDVKTSALENLWLERWREQRLTPLERCDNLRQLELIWPTVEELPDRWVAACPHLETVTITNAEKLTSLPPRLLEDAAALKQLTISGGMLESLPDGFLEGAPNLLRLDLGRNNLRTISSATFAGPALQHLTLDYNKLHTEAVDTLASLSSLTELSLDFNPIDKLCDKNGYSSLKNLSKLKDLSLKSMNITHICRDWRESLRYLVRLDLSYTPITELEFTDIQFTRDASIKRVEVYLYSATISAVRFTEDDFKSAKTLTGTVEVKTFIELKCGCNLYWLWKAINEKTVLLDGIRCEGGQLLKYRHLESCPV